MAKIIGIHGKAGSGKDTVANHLKTYFPSAFRSVAFADPIRAMLIAGFKLTPEHFERPLKNVKLPGIDKTPRDLMKPLGTEWGREMVHADVWIMQIAQQVDDYLGAGLNVLVTDVRFENEAKWIRDNGGVIWHIDRTDGIEIHDHASEKGVKFVKGDKRVNNNETLGHLYDAVEVLAREVIAEQAEKEAAEAVARLKPFMVVPGDADEFVGVGPENAKLALAAGSVA